MILAQAIPALTERASLFADETYGANFTLNFPAAEYIIIDTDAVFLLC